MRGRGWQAVAPYAVAALLAVVLVVVTVNRNEPTQAAQALGDQQLKIMAPADPGGGWDQTARAMQASLQPLVGRTEVYNVGGAGGTIGLSQFRQLEGQSNQIMVMGLVMVGAIAANDSAATLADVTPIAELLTDNQVIVVPTKSPIQSVDDLSAAMRRDIGSVSWAGGSAGGAEQILAGLYAQALGENAGDVNYIAHSGGGEAIATLLSGSATVGVSGISELKPQIDSGALRAVATTGDERAVSLPDTPTLKESGVDAVLTNWRGVVAPKGLTAEQQKALEDLVIQMTESQEWRDQLEAKGWTDAAQAGAPFRTFVTDEQARVDKIIAELGLGS